MAEDPSPAAAAGGAGDADAAADGAGDTGVVAAAAEGAPAAPITAAGPSTQAMAGGAAAITAVMALKKMGNEKSIFRRPANVPKSSVVVAQSGHRDLSAAAAAAIPAAAVGTGTAGPAGGVMVATMVETTVETRIGPDGKKTETVSTRSGTAVSAFGAPGTWHPALGYTDPAKIDPNDMDMIMGIIGAAGGVITLPVFMRLVEKDLGFHSEPVKARMFKSLSGDKDSITAEEFLPFYATVTKGSPEAMEALGWRFYSLAKPEDLIAGNGKTTADDMGKGMQPALDSYAQTHGTGPLVGTAILGKALPGEVKTGTVAFPEYQKAVLVDPMIAGCLYPRYAAAKGVIGPIAGTVPAGTKPAVTGAAAGAKTADSGDDPLLPVALAAGLTPVDLKGLRDALAKATGDKDGEIDVCVEPSHIHHHA